MTEEAKRCVEIMHERGCRGCLVKELSLCTYIEEGRFCDNAYHESADMIESLSKQLEQVTQERDAAVEDLRNVCRVVSVCFCCKSRDAEYVSNDCMDCVNSCNWQWRGVEVDSDAKILH